MKNKITVTKSGNTLSFYLLGHTSHMYLFTQRFSKGVYEYFRKGKSETEIKTFKNWNRDPRLDKTIEKLHLYIQFAQKELLV